MSGLLVRAGELAGARVTDVRVEAGRIVEIGDRLSARRGDVVLEAAGGALLPGLHDHHLHLLSLAASLDSVRCGPPEVTDTSTLAQALRAAPPGWIRGVDYHESVAGLLDRDTLDGLVADRPVRIQHRSGAVWILNSAALAELGLSREDGVECDHAGRPVGRLWRADQLLRHRLGERTVPDLAAVGRRLAALGITGVTDATPNLAEDTVSVLADAVTSGALPQRLQLLGAPAEAPLPARVTVGPHKILPPDHQPPDWDALADEVRAAHTAGRAVAIHAVTRESLVLALAVLSEYGPVVGDRIEHAALVGSDMFPLLAGVAPTVVTQPGFIAQRGAQYERDVPAAEHEDLYRYASLVRAGIRVVPSSDAPFASENPWHTMTAAAHRRTSTGGELAPHERVPARDALHGLLTPLAQPGGDPRRVELGAPADLCLLNRPLADALREPSAEGVHATVCAGEVVFQA